jgi:hypothetical protein
MQAPVTLLQFGRVFLNLCGCLAVSRTAEDHLS